MADYRLFLIGPNGRISRAIEMRCRDDNHAWDVVREHKLDMPAELWQASRRVGVLDPAQNPKP